MALLSFTILLFLSITLINSSYKKENDKTYLNIVTTNKLQYQMIKKIVGNKHNVQYLYKNEDELFKNNSAEETVLDDIDTDIFFYVGNNYEPWIKSFISKMDKSNTTISDMSKGIGTINNSDNKKVNPYYWTSSKEYLIALYNVKSTIEDKDPSNKNYYEDRYKDAVKSINKRVNKITTDIDNNEYTFISIDDKLDYFYKELNINIIKCNKEKVKEYIEENNLDTSKVIILKDVNTDFEYESDIKVVNLYSYNCDLSVEDMIVDNYKQVYKSIY